jgi:hypothetical protein
VYEQDLGYPAARTTRRRGGRRGSRPLRKLEKLRESGAISDEEFEAEKARLLPTSDEN